MDTTKPPQQWEEQYCQQLGQSVQDNSRNLQGLRIGEQWTQIEQQYRIFLDSWNAASLWFEERGLTKFSTYLKAVKENTDKCIAIGERAIQNDINSQAQACAYTRKVNKEISDIIQKAHAERQAMYDKLNEKWRDQFIRQ